MVLRLAIDALWRGRMAYVWLAAVASTFWLLFLVGGSDLFGISMPAASLIGASIAGATLAVPLMGPRELRHLPVTARDLWRATWLLGTVVTVLLLLCTKAVAALLAGALGGSAGITAETIVVSAVYDFAWAGSLLPAFPLLGYAGNKLAGRSPFGAVLTVAAAMAVMLAFFAVPIAAANALPARLADWSIVTAGALITGLVLTFAGLLWTPRRDLLAAASEKPRAARVPARSEAPARSADRLTGISRIAVPYFAFVLMAPPVLLLALILYGAASGQGPWWFIPASPEMIDLSSDGDSPLPYVVLLPAMMVMLASPWAPWIRMLKVMPRSVRELNALVVLTPFAIWMVYWLLGITGYALAYGLPSDFKLGFVFGMAGLGAFAHALLLRWQGGSARWVLPAFAGVLVNVASWGLRSGPSAQVPFAIAGAIALLAGAAVSHQTLVHATSASAAYQRPRPPFGVQQP